MLILAFPDFDYWFLAWFALVPLMWAVEREKDSTAKSFVTGWLFGTIFFFGTCWWLTFAPINYAGFPWWLAYFLLLCVCLVVGLFPALFAGTLSVLLRRFGSWAFLAAPFVWVFTEFLRYWLTGNNWNAIGYSQAFGWWMDYVALQAQTGGIYYVGFSVAIWSSFAASFLHYSTHRTPSRPEEAETFFGAILTFIFFHIPLFSLALVVPILRGTTSFFGFTSSRLKLISIAVIPPLFTGFIALNSILRSSTTTYPVTSIIATVVAVQPNVPMSGVDYTKYDQLRQRQVELSENEISGIKEQMTVNSSQLSIDSQIPIVVILPESPMNFVYNDDREFQQFIGDFARRNNVSVLFNSAEPDVGTTKYFNSAVMVGPDGKEAAQYDKIYLLPFGEAVPRPLEGILPGFVGNFAYGREYDILPVGDAKAGVMICFESHFGALSREYVRNGADVLIEMTNDGYLGPTPVLRQHLANAVFRAVETNRPVLRVTNVGITAYINERGQVLDEAPSYQEATRVWSVAKSDGSQTFYVKYGDWFAWLCSIVTFGLFIFALRNVRK